MIHFKIGLSFRQNKTLQQIYNFCVFFYLQHEIIVSMKTLPIGVACSILQLMLHCYAESTFTKQGEVNLYTFNRQFTFGGPIMTEKLVKIENILPWRYRVTFDLEC